MYYASGFVDPYLEKIRVFNNILCVTCKLNSNVAFSFPYPTQSQVSIELNFMSPPRLKYVMSRQYEGPVSFIVTVSIGI